MQRMASVSLPLGSDRKIIFDYFIAKDEFIRLVNYFMTSSQTKAQTVTLPRLYFFWDMCC